jgi:HEPN domain-containing protein
MTTSTDEAMLLLRKADQDIAAFGVLRNAPGIDAETALFHAQQAVEKCLKAALAFHEVAYRKTHDLDELVDRVLDQKIGFPFPADAFSILSPFAAQVRYEHLPLEGIRLEDAERMIADARTWAGDLLR